MTYWAGFSTTSSLIYYNIFILYILEFNTSRLTAIPTYTPKIWDSWMNSKTQSYISVTLLHYWYFDINYFINRFLSTTLLYVFIIISRLLKKNSSKFLIWIQQFINIWSISSNPLLTMANYVTGKLFILNMFDVK